MAYRPRKHYVTYIDILTMKLLLVSTNRKSPLAISYSSSVVLGVEILYIIAHKSRLGLNPPPEEAAFESCTKWAMIVFLRIGT
jgi:hypothetical protein